MRSVCVVPFIVCLVPPVLLQLSPSKMGFIQTHFCSTKRKVEAGVWRGHSEATVSPLSAVAGPCQEEKRMFLRIIPSTDFESHSGMDGEVA